MRVLHLSAYDIRGGAARAAFRIHTAVGMQMDSFMSVNTKESDDSRVTFPSSAKTRMMAKIRMQLNYEPARHRFPDQQSMFSNGLLNTPQTEVIERVKPDIINLHWITEGLVSIKALDRFKQPVVWTVHDMWTFTGGCHYTEGCESYKSKCGKCPQLHSNSAYDFSTFIFNQKKKNRKKITFVAPSQWMKDCIESSAIYRGSDVHVIPYPIDQRLFALRDKSTVREILGLPLNKKLVLFGAMNPLDERKGFKLLSSAINQLHADAEFNSESVELVIFGSSKEQKELSGMFKVHYLGKLSDELSLALAYNACDIFVAPSVQDNLPNTVIESLSSGVPVVAFNIGGMPDMITHGKTGYLANSVSSEALAQGIKTVLLGDTYRFEQACREDALRNFSQQAVAQKYKELYEGVIAAEGRGR